MNLFEATCTHDSSSTAIKFGKREITYGELRAETLKMARVISSLRASRDDRIAILLHDSPEFIEAFIATCSLGAIAVPINMALRPDEQCSIVHNSGARLAFIEDDLCHTLLTHEPEKLQSLKELVSLHDLKGLMAHAADSEPPVFPTPGVDDPAFILYTSGSTG